LTDDNIAKKIVDSLTLVNNETTVNCLEIGPGKGVLTKYLLKKPEFNLKVVEFDQEAIAYLNKNFDNISEKIIQKDVLKLDFQQIFEPPVYVIGNLPYNITAPIFFLLLENRNIIPQMVAMIQKEVAERIASKHNNKVYGIMSVLLQTFFKIEYLFTVNENIFSPPPKVKSAVIRLTKLKEHSQIDDWNTFKNIVKAAFNQRRKTLKNALSLYDTSKIPPDFIQKRAEELSVSDFYVLYKSLKDN